MGCMHSKIVLLTGAALLAACGGGGGGGDGGGIDPRLARLDVYEAQKLRVLGNPAVGVAAMPATSGENVPDSGGYDFAGSATIRVEVPNNTLALFGDAALTLDFDGGTTSGTLDNFFGQAGGSGVADYEGSITLSGGAPAGAFAISYDGSLSATNQTLVFGGVMTATLLGSSAEAIAASDLEATVTQNGRTRDATLIVIGEYVPPPPPEPE